MLNDYTFVFILIGVILLFEVERILKVSRSLAQERANEAAKTARAQSAALEQIVKSLEGLNEQVFDARQRLS